MPSRRPRIKCVLCSSVSPLTAADVDGLTLHRRRVVAGSVCPTTSELLTLYCVDCNERTCATCRGTTHAQHNVETLEAALPAAVKLLDLSRHGLQERGAELDGMIVQLKEKKVTLSTALGQRQTEAAQAFADLRERLAAKEKEYMATMEAMERSKTSRLTFELARCEERLQTINKIQTNITTQLDSQSTPLPLLTFLEANEQEIRLTRNTPLPALPNEAAEMVPECLTSARNSL
jgi:Zn ribbon nucleic-acid-binding protein